MTIAELRKNIVSCANEMYFEYNGKKCGVDQEIRDSIPTYEIWYGETLKIHTNFDKMVHDKIFDGESILDLLDVVKFNFI